MFENPNRGKASDIDLSKVSANARKKKSFLDSRDVALLVSRARPDPTHSDSCWLLYGWEDGGGPHGGFQTGLGLVAQAGVVPVVKRTGGSSLSTEYRRYRERAERCMRILWRYAAIVVSVLERRTTWRGRGRSLLRESRARSTAGALRHGAGDVPGR